LAPREIWPLSFSRKKVPLGDGAFREFGAVSDDGSIVVAIRRSSGKTSGNNLPTGKIQLIFKDLHLLSLVNAKRKALVLTDKEFLEIVKAETLGTLPGDIELLHCKLPPRLDAIVKAVRQSATEEMDGGRNK
jgi:hypothetical protein